MSGNRWDNYNWPPLLKLVHIDQSELKGTTATTGKAIFALSHSIFIPLIMNLVFCILLVPFYILDLQILIQLASVLCATINLCVIPVWGFANYYFAFRALLAHSMKHCIAYIVSQGLMCVFFAWMAFGCFFNSNGLLRLVTIVVSVAFGHSGTWYSWLWGVSLFLVWTVIVLIETVVWIGYIVFSAFCMARVFQQSYFGRAAQIAGVAARFT